MAVNFSGEVLPTPEEIEHATKRVRIQVEYSSIYKEAFLLDTATNRNNPAFNKDISIKPENKRFLLPFIQLMASVFILFFLTVGLSKPAADLLSYMNSKDSAKPLSEWIVFSVTAPIATAIWSMFWLWFKASEKQCVDLLSKK